MTAQKTDGPEARITDLPRVFRYNGLDLPDPNPQADPDGVREIYAGTYPELANAGLKGPSFEAGQMVYSFHPAAGVKG